MSSATILHTDCWSRIIAALLSLSLSLSSLVIHPVFLCLFVFNYFIYFLFYFMLFFLCTYLLPITLCCMFQFVCVSLYSLSVKFVLALQWRMLEHIHSQPASIIYADGCKWLQALAHLSQVSVSVICTARVVATCPNACTIPTLIRQSDSRPKYATCEWLSTITPTITLSPQKFGGCCTIITQSSRDCIFQEQ